MELVIDKYRIGIYHLGISIYVPNTACEIIIIQVAGSRSKKREGAGAVDLQAECQGDGTEMQVGRR